VVVKIESDQQRRKRHRQRGLFNGVAELYDDCRQGYPDEVVECMIETSGVSAGSAVLEVGCGTGQLTQSLVTHGFALTAIDIGPSMIGAARGRVEDSVKFEVVSFEDFDAPDGSFDLIVSATAFHWLDPEVQFTKPARLLRPGGWLAVLGTRETYDDPFGTTLVNMWTARTDDGGARAREPGPTVAEMVSDTGLFGPPRTINHSKRLVLPVEVVVGVENTRATSLSWSADDQEAFASEMRQHLRDHTEITGTQRTSLTMARVRPRP
jgi:ubiquinone/menaquinone biosynthesis C-methylase UbiE